MNDILTLANALAEAESHLRYLGYMNAPLDAAERVKADARYRLALEAKERALKAYNVALGALSSEQLAAITRDDWPKN